MARKESDKRITATIPAEVYDKIQYIADKKGISVSEVLREAIDLEIRYVNEDYYPLAKIEAERINQLVDHQSILSSDIRNLESLIIEGFSSLLNLTKGDNYLYEEDQNGNT